MDVPHLSVVRWETSWFYHLCLVFRATQRKSPNNNDQKTRPIQQSVIAPLCTYHVLVDSTHTIAVFLPHTAIHSTQPSLDIPSSIYPSIHPSIHLSLSFSNLFLAAHIFPSTLVYARVQREDPIKPNMQRRATITSNVSQHSEHRLQQQDQPTTVVRGGRRKQQQPQGVSWFGLVVIVGVILAVVMLLASQHHLMRQVETERAGTGLQNAVHRQVPPKPTPSKITPQFLPSRETEEGSVVQRANSIRQRNEKQEVGLEKQGVAAPNENKIEKETKRNTPLDVAKTATKVQNQEQSAPVSTTTTTTTTTTTENLSNSIGMDMNSTTSTNTTEDLSRTIAYAISLIKCHDKQTNTRGLIDAALVLRHSVHMTSSRNPESGSKYDYHMIALIRNHTRRCANVLYTLGFDDVIVVEDPIVREDIRGQDLRENIQKEWCCGHCEYDEK